MFDIFPCLPLIRFLFASCLLQNESVKLRLFEAQPLWDSAENKLTQIIQRSLRRSQTIDCYSNPQLFLQAQRESHQKLQVGPVCFVLIFFYLRLRLYETCSGKSGVSVIHIQILFGCYLQWLTVVCLNQLLYEETEASEAEWDEVNQTVSLLREIISPAAATLITEQLDRERDRWDRNLMMTTQTLI